VLLVAFWAFDLSLRRCGLGVVTTSQSLPQ
jgi:hypothetical protein